MITGPYFLLFAVPAFLHLANVITSKLRHPTLNLLSIPHSMSQHVVTMPEVPLRSRQSVTINAPLESVWEYNADLVRITEFHPRVESVELIDRRSRRAFGTGYKCHLRGGRHTCVERDVEVAPMARIVTLFLEDSFGVTRLLTDY